MKIWLSKNSEVSVREQIIAQITLGITSGDLRVGEKLPSTQELARRFRIHSNTVSNAYQKLAGGGWIEFKKGSGFYVCEVSRTDSADASSLDSLISDFLKTAQLKGFSRREIQNRLEQRFAVQSAKQLLLIESDEDFREILIEEIREKNGCEISGISFEDFRETFETQNAVFVAMSDEEGKIQKILPSGRTCLYLKSRSVPASMAGEARPGREHLIAVVSGWEKFLLLAKTILIAAEIESDSLIVRSTKAEKWQNGLKDSAMIICDSLTAKKIPHKTKLRSFYLISDESLDELQTLTRQ